MILADFHLYGPCRPLDVLREYPLQCRTYQILSLSRWVILGLLGVLNLTLKLPTAWANGSIKVYPDGPRLRLIRGGISFSCYLFDTCWGKRFVVMLVVDFCCLFASLKI